MQGYGGDNDPVWSTEEPAVLRSGEDRGMALDVRDVVAWLERVEEAHRGHRGGGHQPAAKLLRVQGDVGSPSAPPTVRTDDYLRALLKSAITYQGIRLLSQRGHPKEVGGEVRRLIRGYEGIPTKVARCVLRSQTTYSGLGMPTRGGGV